MCSRRRTISMPVPFIFVLAITLGLLLLLSGLCVILVWTFVPTVSTYQHPIGLKVGAVVCSVGVIWMLVSLVSMYRWQLRKLNRQARLQTVQSDNSGCEKCDKKKVYQFATISSFSTSDTETLTNLKKAASTTSFLPLSALQEGETVKVVGVLHGTISSSALSFPNRSQSTDEVMMVVGRALSEDVWSSSVQLSGNGVRGGAKYISKPFVRDKALRRSLPRVLVHPPGSKQLNGISTSVIRSDNLAKSKSEGVKLDDLSKPNPTEKLITKSQTSQPDALPTESTGPKAMYREVSFMPNIADDQVVDAPPRKADTNTPMKQGSLFNITTDGRAVSVADQGSGGSLEGAAASTRVLLMNQSGQVISCTTLFNNDDDDDGTGLTGEDDESNGDGIRCRHLQNYSGLSFFPLYIERNRSTGDEVGHYTGDQIEENNNRMDNTDDISQHNTACRAVSHLSVNSRPPRSKRGLWPRIQNLFQHLWPPFKRKEKLYSLSEASQPFLQPITPTASASQSKSRETDYTIQLERNNYSVDSKECISSIETTTGEVETKKRKLTVLSNASVFSLPATSPDKWTIEKPLWIMGVPVNNRQDEPEHQRMASGGAKWLAAAVDAYDHVIVVQKNERTKILTKKTHAPPGSADSVDDEPISPSFTFMHALHVKPPPRMRIPRSQLRTRSRRATSLGRILTSNSNYLQDT